MRNKRLLSDNVIRYACGMAIRESGITYEQVAAAADSLVADGAKATVRAIRAAIGGSPNVILRHLQTWRSRQQAAPIAVREMPPVMVRAYYEEMARVAAEARADVEVRLVEAQTETADLVRASDDLERERDALLEQLAIVTRERDELHGKQEAQAQEIDELREKLDREMRAAEDARISLAQERHNGESTRERLDTARVEVDRLRLEFGREHIARVEAEREQARLHAANSAAYDRLGDLAEREQRAMQEALELRLRVEQLLAVERAAALENTRLSAQLEAHGKHAEDWDRHS